MVLGGLVDDKFWNEYYGMTGGLNKWDFVLMGSLTKTIIEGGTKIDIYLPFQRIRTAMVSQIKIGEREDENAPTAF